MVVEGYEGVSVSWMLCGDHGTVTTNRRHPAGLLDRTFCNCKDCD